MPIFKLTLNSLSNSLPLQFTAPHLGQDFPWNEPTFAVCAPHVIRPSVNQSLGWETPVTTAILSGKTLVRLDLSQDVAAAILCSASGSSQNVFV